MEDPSHISPVKYSAAYSMGREFSKKRYCAYQMTFTMGSAHSIRGDECETNIYSKTYTEGSGPFEPLGSLEPSTP